MSENTYLEQYLNQVILPRYLHDWLMEALKEMKGKKNAGQLKKVHELIDRVEKSGKKLALYEKVFLELMVTDDKYMRNRLNRMNNDIYINPMTPTRRTEIDEGFKTFYIE